MFTGSKGMCAHTNSTGQTFIAYPMPVRQVEERVKYHRIFYILRMSYIHSTFSPSAVILWLLLNNNIHAHITSTGDSTTTYKQSMCVQNMLQANRDLCLVFTYIQHKHIVCLWVAGASIDGHFSCIC